MQSSASTPTDLVPTELVSIHHPLKSERREIRLLILDPAVFEAAISCQLLICSLDEDPKYEALSYTWGGPGESQLVTMNGILWEVTNNLKQALLHLRLEDEPRTLWVDAICINQNDNEEKSQQVQMMAQIYRCASCVRAWIGLSKEDPSEQRGTLVTTGIEPGQLNNYGEELNEDRMKDDWNVENILEVFGTPDRFDCWDRRRPIYLTEGKDTIQMLDHLTHCLKSESGLKAWQTLTELVESRYWKRVWIQQEIFSNPRVSIHYGHKSAPFESWIRALTAYFQLQNSSLRIGPKSLDVSERLLLHLTSVLAIGRRRLFKDRIWSEHHVLLLLYDQVSRGAHDPKDKIYGLLDMIGPWNRDGFEVNYDASIPEVYSKAVQALVTNYKSLDVLTSMPVCPIALRLAGLPTWCPDWSHFTKPVAAEVSEPAEIYAGDIPHNLNMWQHTYDANGKSIEARAQFLQNGMVLRCDGVLLDKIEAVADSSFSLDSEEMVEQVGKLAQDARNGFYPDQIEALWRTLVSDRAWSANYLSSDFPIATGAPEAYSVPFNFYVKRKRAKELENDLYQVTKEFFPADQQPAPGQSSQAVSDHIASLLIPFYRSCKMATMHRRFFISNKKYMGLAPNQARPGDSIVVLLGCFLPVILRVVEDHFEFIGEAYVHGWMHGRAIELAEKDELPVYYFNIH